MREYCVEGHFGLATVPVGSPIFITKSPARKLNFYASAQGAKLIYEKFLPFENDMNGENGS